MKWENLLNFIINENKNVLTNLTFKKKVVHCYTLTNINPFMAGNAKKIFILVLITCFGAEKSNHDWQRNQLNVFHWFGSRDKTVLYFIIQCTIYIIVLSIHLYLYLSIYLSIYLSLYLYLSLYIYINLSILGRFRYSINPFLFAQFLDGYRITYKFCYCRLIHNNLHTFSTYLY